MGSTRRSIIIFLFAALVATPAVAQQVGGGVTIFIPEASWLGHGSVSYEAQVKTAIGLGGLLSAPIGLAYDQVYGLLPNDSSASANNLPWAITDSFMLTAGLRLTIPISIMFVEAEGGGVVQWNAGLIPLEGNIAASLASPGTVWGFQSIEAVAPFGYGYYAGAAIGMDVKGVRLTLSGGYRYTLSPLTLTGSYYQTNTTTLATTAGSLDRTDLALRLAGVYIGLNGSFSF